MQGPVDVFTGRYGYYKLIEEEGPHAERIACALGAEWQIEKLSHKPFPSGRLTHGVVHGLRDLMARHGFVADEVTEVTCRVPPLVRRLVGRPDIADPASNYAKLCLPFVAGVWLAKGACNVPDFRGEALRDPRVHAFAAKVRIEPDGNANENALDPQQISVKLSHGAVHTIHLPHTYGHPAVPLTAAENEDKFRRCCANAVPARPASTVDRLLAQVTTVQSTPDISTLVRAMVRQD